MYLQISWDANRYGELFPKADLLGNFKDTGAGDEHEWGIKGFHAELAPCIDGCSHVRVVVWVIPSDK